MFDAIKNNSNVRLGIEGFTSLGRFIKDAQWQAARFVFAGLDPGSGLDADAAWTAFVFRPGQQINSGMINPRTLKSVTREIV